MPVKRKKTPIKVIHRKLGREKAYGQAWKDDRIIEVDERITGKIYLDTLCHEILHCQFPKLPEITINAMATELANILWDCGFRWVDLEEK